MEKAIERARAVVASVDRLVDVIAKTEAARPEIAAIEAALVKASADKLLGEGTPAAVKSLAARAARVRQEAATNERVLADFRQRLGAHRVELAQAREVFNQAWERQLAAEFVVLLTAMRKTLEPARERLAELAGSMPRSFASHAARSVAEAFKALDRVVLQGQSLSQCITYPFKAEDLAGAIEAAAEHPLDASVLADLKVLEAELERARDLIAQGTQSRRDGEQAPVRPNGAAASAPVPSTSLAAAGSPPGEGA